MFQEQGRQGKQEACLKDQSEPAFTERPVCHSALKTTLVLDLLISAAPEWKARFRTVLKIAGQMRVLAARPLPACCVLFIYP